MNKIIPSTKLRVVTVHKLKSLTCLRRHFWRWILNLESRQLNLNFWYGSLMGAGFEALISGKDPTKAINAEDRRYRRRYIITGEMEDEMRLQRQLIEAYITQAKKHPKVRKMKMKTSQVPFKVRLQESRLWFCGTPDGNGTYYNKPVIFEEKTAGKVTNAYIDALSFNKQVFGYAYARRLAKKPVLPQCCYCIFRKPQKRIKRGQTIDDFVAEIRQDLINRPAFYYIFHKLTLGRLTIAETGHDIESLAVDLKERHKRLNAEDGLLDPHSWPKQEDKCYDYKGCEFLSLCKNPKKWQIYLRLYQQREMLYEEEKKELQK